MAKASPQITSFTAGELSPKLEGRTDLDKYSSGARKLQNMLVHPHGGAARRSGTEFTGPTNSNKKTRIIPFEYSAEETYGLVFEPNHFWVVRDGEEVIYEEGSENYYRHFLAREVLERQLRDRGYYANSDGYKGNLNWDFNDGHWNWSSDGLDCFFVYTNEPERLFPGEVDDSLRWADLLWLSGETYLIHFKASVPFDIRTIVVHDVIQTEIGAMGGYDLYNYTNHIDANTRSRDYIIQWTPDGAQMHIWFKGFDTTLGFNLITGLTFQPDTLWSFDGFFRQGNWTLVEIEGSDCGDSPICDIAFGDLGYTMDDVGHDPDIVNGDGSSLWPGVYTLHEDGRILEWIMQFSFVPSDVPLSYAIGEVQFYIPNTSTVLSDYFGPVIQPAFGSGRLNLTSLNLVNNTELKAFLTIQSGAKALNHIWLTVDVGGGGYSRDGHFVDSTPTLTFNGSEETNLRETYIYEPAVRGVFADAPFVHPLNEWGREKLGVLISGVEHRASAVSSNLLKALRLRGRISRDGTVYTIWPSEAFTRATASSSWTAVRPNWKDMGVEGPWQNLFASSATAYGTSDFDQNEFYISNRLPQRMCFPHSYSEDVLADVRYAQTADTMYLVQKDNHPIKVVRYDNDDWRSEVPRFRYGPLLDPLGLKKDEYEPYKVIDVDDISGIGQVETNEPIFTLRDVGRMIKTHQGWGLLMLPTGTYVTSDYDKKYARWQAVIVETEHDVGAISFLTTASGSIRLFEGDPSSTGIEHNDRLQVIVTPELDLLKLGFKKGMSVSVYSNPAGTTVQSGLDEKLIVEAAEDTLLFAPGVDVPSSNSTPTTINDGMIREKPIPDALFQVGAFSATTGFPSAVSIFQERLILAGTKEQPQTIFFSKAGDLENFRQGTDANDAMTYTIGSNSNDEITYLQPARTLIVGTTGGEFSVAASGGILTPTTTTINKQASYGSSLIQPVSAGNITLFAQRSGRKIRELVYDFNSDSYYAPDLTLLAEHITQSGITSMTYQQEPDQIVWATLGDGRLAGLTYRREENVTAWHQHKFGGFFGSTPWGIAEDVASIRTATDEEDLYVVVKRTIDGETKRYVERLSDINPDRQSASTWYVDSGIEYSGAPTSVLTGLEHLEGQTVSILADGSQHRNLVVTGGSITLDRDAEQVVVGLPYKSVLETMRLDFGGTEGTSQAKTKRIRAVTVRMFETGFGIKVGSQENEIQEIYFRDSFNAMGSGIPLFTGDYELEFAGGFDADARIYIEQEQPVPTTILAIYPLLQTWDK